jgi:hypothetical protein
VAIRLLAFCVLSSKFQQFSKIRVIEFFCWSDFVWSTPADAVLIGVPRAHRVLDPETPIAGLGTGEDQGPDRLCVLEDDPMFPLGRPMQDGEWSIEDSLAAFPFFDREMNKLLRSKLVDNQIGLKRLFEVPSGKNEARETPGMVMEMRILIPTIELVKQQPRFTAATFPQEESTEIKLAGVVSGDVLPSDVEMKDPEKDQG